jgi:hypothetical protein
MRNSYYRTIAHRLSYSKKYCRILQIGEALELLGLSKDKRIHAMKALDTLSKYVGCYDEWKDIRERHQLSSQVKAALKRSTTL